MRLELWQPSLQPLTLRFLTLSSRAQSSPFPLLDVSCIHVLPAGDKRQRSAGTAGIGNLVLPRGKEHLFQSQSRARLWPSAGQIKRSAALPSGGPRGVLGRQGPQAALYLRQQRLAVLLPEPSALCDDGNEGQHLGRRELGPPPRPRRQLGQRHVVPLRRRGGGGRMASGACAGRHAPAP